MDITLLLSDQRQRPIRIYPGTDNRATVTVRYLTPEDQLQVKAEADRLAEKEGKDRETAARIAYGRIAVKGWDGIAANGAPYPFTPENAEFLMLNCPEFRQAVIESSMSLRRDAEKN